MAGETSRYCFSVDTVHTRKSLDFIDTGRESLRSYLTNLYGEEIYRKSSTFSLLRHKSSKLLCTLTFLIRCRDNNIVPGFLKIRNHLRTRSSENILRRASLALLRERIRSVRCELDSVSRKLLSLHLELSSVLSAYDWQKFDCITAIQSQITYDKSKQSHILKFNKLVPRTKSNFKTNSLTQTVKNLSSYPLSQSELSVLSKGLNFSLAPKRVPVDEIISSVETSLRKLPREISDPIRFETVKCLRNAKPPASNISREEKLVLNKLKSNSQIAILQADKGNATVVMDQNEYISKMNSLLNDGSYVPIRRDPTHVLEREISSLIKSSDIPVDLHKSLIPRASKPPRIYGLPKIHKPDCPLRPIVSTIDSPTYNLAKYLSKILQEFTGNSPSFIRNSAHFVEKIADVTLQPSDILVSFDVTSLFTKVPISDSIEIIRKLFIDSGKPVSLADLVEKCLTSMFFVFRDKFYKQVSGAAMGSPLSPVVANIFMEHFEKTALDSAVLKPSFWFRYVDDTFVVWPHGRESLDNFLNHINNQHPNISFTMEVENEKSLPFLDVLVTRKSNCKLGHAVYRKPTHTDRYLHANSHHHPSQKISVVSSLVHRAVVISEPENLHSELEHVRNSLQNNGYSRRVIDKTIKRFTTPRSPNNNLENKTYQSFAVLPFVRGVTDKIGRILHKNDIKVCYKPACKLSQVIPSQKDRRLPLSSCGVYRIPCSCGSVYIGETGRSVSTRLSEHKRNVKSGHVLTSAVAEHQHNTGHNILFDQASVISPTSGFFQRKFRESLEIWKHPNNFNRDNGFFISPIYRAICQATPNNQSGTPALVNPDAANRSALPTPI